MPAAWAATGWNGTTLFIGDPNNQVGVNRDGITNVGSVTEDGVTSTTFESVDASIKGSNITIWADKGDNEAVSANIETLTVSNGTLLTVSKSGWGPRYFDALNIETLEAKDGGAVSLNINYEGGYTNKVVIKKVTGSISGATLSSTGELTLGTADGTTTFSGTINNGGTMTVNGAVAVTNLSNFTVETAGTESWSDTTNSQGFQVSNGATYVLSTSNVTYTSGLTAVNDNGEMRAVTISEDGKVTFQGGNVTGTTYYLINADVTAGAAGTEGATAYDVAAGRTLYIVDGSADSATLTFAAGSTLDISNASRSFTATNLAQNVVIGDGGIVTVAGENWGAAHIRGIVDVEAGGKLVLNGHDSMGWSNDSIKTINMAGSADKLATVELHGKQTLKTNVNLNGNAIMTNAGDGALEFFGGNISASGTNNTIEGNLQARSAGSITVAEGGTLTVTGNLTCDTSQYPNPGTIIKAGTGELILAGTNNAYGLIDVQAGSLVLNNGLTTANSGGLNLSEGASLTTGATIYHNGSGSVTLNGTIVIDTTDLTKFEMAAAGGEVTYSDGADGFMTTSGATYYLVKGAASGTTTSSSGNHVLTYGESGVTFTDSSSTTSEEYYVNTAAAQSADGTFMYKLNSAEAVLNVNGTLSNSRIIMGEGKVAVSAGNTLSINTAGDNAKPLLLTTTGDGTIALGTNLTLTGEEATAATGTLSIGANTQLQIGDKDTHTASISSFSKVELDGGKIYFSNKEDTFNNLTTTTKGGELYFYDMGKTADGALTTLAGTTTLNGNLTVKNTYNTQLAVEKLAGTGNFVLNGSDSAETIAVSINGTDNYSGKVHVTNNATNLQLTVAADLGVQVLVDSRTADDVQNGIDLTGIGAGNTITLKGARGYFAKGSTIVADVVISNSDNGAWAGMEINDGSSESTNTFAGSVSGAGNFVLNHARLTNFKTKFTGDVSGWTGILDLAQGDNYVTFTGDATEINNSKILMRAGAGKTADLTFDHDQAVTVKSEIARNSGTVSLTLNNSSEAGITFTAGRIDANNLTLQSGTKAAFTGITNLSVTNLTLDADTMLTIGNGTAVVDGSAAPALAVTGTAELTGGATINGGLDLSNATAITLNGMDAAITINGDLTLPGTAISLSGNVLEALSGLTAGQQVALFDVTGAFTLGETEISLLELGDKLLTDVFSVANVEWNEDIYLGYDGATVYAGVMDTTIPVDPTVPEPTTATLSLLALAALAARRRRK